LTGSGFEGRDDYGAVGPVANLASRLSTHDGGQILIGQRVFSAVEEAVETARVGELDLQGLLAPSSHTRFSDSDSPQGAAGPRRLVSVLPNEERALR
jgi:class 3 adenylate cyclase